MIWIGITGPMGGGKSSVANLLRARGFPVIDADAVAHELMTCNGLATADIIKTFGESVRAVDGSIDRRALGNEVFGHGDRLALLENILHPRVRERVAQLRSSFSAAGAKVGFYDVPLLFEKNMQSQFDAILVVSAKPEVRMRRLVARTGLTESEIEKRWKSQLSADYKESHATIVVRNDGDWKTLEVAVDVALRALGLSPTAAET